MENAKLSTLDVAKQVALIFGIWLLAEAGIAYVEGFIEGWTSFG